MTEIPELNRSISPNTNLDVRFAPDSERRSDMVERLKCASTGLEPPLSVALTLYSKLCLALKSGGLSLRVPF